ncbi:MAG: SGNH/GDSL hydrolase family protein [Candidatus Omnitrophota bacterium]
MKKINDNIAKILKHIIFSLFCLAVIFLFLELGLRLCEKFKRNVREYCLESEKAGLDIEDNKLFWKMKPNIDIVWQGVNIKTNSLGLRDYEISPIKEQKVFRMLSLGESTTFGAKVEFENIYSEVLENKLNKDNSDYIFEVINAGVSAYTSFQSLIYLKEQGLKLNPDMILIYHQANDNLPATIRKNKNAFDFSLSDRQLYNLRNNFSGILYQLNKSFVYGAMKNYLLKIRMCFLKNSATTLRKSLPDLTIVDIKRKCRVPLDDRKEIFKEFLEISEKNKITLVLIHPIYKKSLGQKCFLTEFAEQNNVPLIETFEAFKQSGYSPEELFYDSMHPTATGHKIIADCIFKYIKAYTHQLLHEKVAEKDDKN